MVSAGLAFRMAFKVVFRENADSPQHFICSKQKVKVFKC